MNPPPEFIQYRINLYDQIKKKRAEELQGPGFLFCIPSFTQAYFFLLFCDPAAKAKTEISVTLRDGKVIPGVAWETTPYSVAKGISKQMADKMVVAKVCVHFSFPFFFLSFFLFFLFSSMSPQLKLGTGSTRSTRSSGI